MRTHAWILICFLHTALLHSQDQVVYLSHGGADAMFVLPEGVDPVRGVIIHAANMQLRPSDRWTEIARANQMAHMVMRIDMRQNNRPRILRNAVLPLLYEASERLGRLDVSVAPVAATGHSAGGMGLNAFLPLGERFLTAAIDCSWVLNYEQNPGAMTTPLLFTLGAVPDGFNMLEAITNHYDPARKQGATASLGLEWGKAHNFANAATLFAAWFTSIAQLRLPEEPGPLLPVDPQTGWLGDRGSWESDNPRVYPLDEFPGDPSEAVWLPDRGFAMVWRAYQSKSPPAQLRIENTVSGQSLGAFRPRSSHEFRTPAGDPLRFSLDRTPESPIREVRFYHRDQVLASREEAPWEAEVELPPGAYPVFAEVHLKDGGVFVTNPALLLLAPRNQSYEDVR